MARCGIFKLHTFLLALTIALTIAEDGADESAERQDMMRTARCEHHDHDEKSPSKWLAKFKKTKLYGPSKSQHRQKTHHYGQPKSHFRPPPQYVVQTNYNIPSFHPPAAIPPPTSYPHHLQNPNVLPQQHSYSPVKIYGSPPQVQSFNHPAHLPLAPTEAPPTYTNAPYPQDPEDLEGYSLVALVHNPLVPHSPPQVPVSSVNIYGYPAQNFNRPAHSSLVSTEAPVPSTYSNTPYRQDPLAPEIPTVSVNNPSASPSQVPVSPASYDPPSPNHLEIADHDPPAITPPVSTEATVNQTVYYSNAPSTRNDSLPTTTPNSQEAAKTEKVIPYFSRRPSRRPSKAPTHAPSTVYSSPVATERTTYYTSPSYSDFENPPVSSNTPAFYPSPATTSYDPSTDSPPVTEAPAYFPPYFGDDFDSQSFDDPYPEPPSYLPPKFPSYDDSPSQYYNPSSFFKESQNVSPPVYSEEPFQKANSRPSPAEIPDYYSNEEERDAWKDDDEEEFFQQAKFPRFDEFVKQMMSIGKK